MTDDGQARLRQLAYVVLAPSVGRRRRSQLAETLAQNCAADLPDYDTARVHLLHDVLHGAAPRVSLQALGFGGRPRTAEDRAARATEQALAAMMPAARAAFVLIHLEGLDPDQTWALLGAAGVQDPQTVTSSAGRSDLDPAAVRALSAAASTGRARPRLLVTGVAVLVIGLTIPVIAATANDRDDTPGPVTGQLPAATDEVDGADEVSGADQTKVTRDLARILRRIDQQVARGDLDGAQLKKLLTLRAAVVDEQQRLAR